MKKQADVLQVEFNEMKVLVDSFLCHEGVKMNDIKNHFKLSDRLITALWKSYTYCGLGVDGRSSNALHNRGLLGMSLEIHPSVSRTLSDKVISYMKNYKTN